MPADPLAFVVPMVWIGAYLLVLRGVRRSRRKQAAPPPREVSPRPIPKTTEELEAAIAAEETQPRSIHLAILLHRLSQLRAQEGRLLEAEQIAGRLSELFRDLPEVGPQDLIAAGEHHVALLQALGRTGEAERIQRQVVEASKRGHPRPSLAVARPRIALAAILNVSGRYGEPAFLASAEVSRRQTREVLRR